MQSTTSWPAPAKLNLMLRIVGRREDGYHLLQTVFQFLNLHDRLFFQLTEDGEIQRSYCLPGVDQDGDLILKAARLLQDYSGSRQGVVIGLEKKLPMGGGLGGGSSDAATVLVALNQLWGLGLSTPTLAQLGLALGADVPVFVHGHAAWAEGVGEDLQPIEIPEPWYLVLIPGCHVATAAVFNDPELTRDSKRITIRDFLAGAGGNDCERVVVKAYPEVADALAWLGQYVTARMTGTGACVYAEFTHQADALMLHHKVPARFHSFVAKGLNRSPLLHKVADI